MSVPPYTSQFLRSRLQVVPGHLVLQQFGCKPPVLCRMENIINLQKCPCPRGGPSFLVVHSSRKPSTTRSLLGFLCCFWNPQLPELSTLLLARARLAETLLGHAKPLLVRNTLPGFQLKAEACRILCLTIQANLLSNRVKVAAYPIVFCGCSSTIHSSPQGVCLTPHWGSLNSWVAVQERLPNNEVSELWSLNLAS